MMNTSTHELIQRYSAMQYAACRLQLMVWSRCRMWLWHCHNPAGEIAKRGLDLTLSGIALLLLTPLFLLIAALIRAEDGGPVLFTQTRVGRFGQQFKMYKFRSMCPNAEARLQEVLAENQHKEGITFKIRNDPRLTRTGKWLRRFSLDELPQIWNVFKGDMTLVGPRPPVPREVARYTLADRRRLAVKPGLTCLWQIGGRSEVDFSGSV